jgi:hypothetical protein
VGTVVDKSTKLPISGAMIRFGQLNTYTNKLGQFELPARAFNDTLKIIKTGYKTYSTCISKPINNLQIELESKVIALNEVVVHGDRDFKKDSVANRNAYAKQFNYVGPTIKDAFSDNPNKQPGELISINPLILIAALTKKSTPEYKFQQSLIKDEHSEYVNRKFNSGSVSGVTGLKGDTLSRFLIQYRPTYDFAKKATEYDMEVYIMDCFGKFKKAGFLEGDPFKN